jgi:hypothetical protein
MLYHFTFGVGFSSGKHPTLVVMDDGRWRLALSPVVAGEIQIFVGDLF